MTTENSVLMALGELQSIEEKRIATEQEARRTAEREAREAAEREAKRRAEAEAQAEAEREHAERVAREEARLNVEAVVDSRTKDADQRIASMKAELAAIQAERQAFQLRMVDATTRIEPRRSRGWAAAFGIAMVACAALATLVIVQITTPPPPPRVVIHEVEVPVAVETPDTPEAPVVAQVVEPEPEPETTRGRNPNRNRVQMQETMRDRHDMAFERMEACGDDPLCMLD